MILETKVAKQTVWNHIILLYNRGLLYIYFALYHPMDLRTSDNFISKPHADINDLMKISNKDTNIHLQLDLLLYLISNSV